jgi:fatty-acyl-CoA synthase
MTVGREGPVPDFVRLHARGRPDSIALADAGSGRGLGYRALDHLVDCAVTVLRESGVEPGGRVAALSRNSIELVILHLACARASAILAPLNWRLSAAELRALLDDCEPALLYGDDRIAAAGETGLLMLTAEEFGRRIGQAEPAPFEAGDAARPSLMLYTSGTSGKPKGVLLSEANLFATAVNFAVIGEVSARSAFLVDSPMFHVIGMVTNVRPALMMGARVVVSGGFDPAVTLERLADPGLGISHYFCVPQMAEMLRAVPGFDPGQLRGLKAVFTGGAPHPAARIREWLADGIPIVDGYGMTEAGTVLGMPLSIPVIDRKAGSAGLLPPTIEHRLVRDDGGACGPGEAGELLLRGPNICVGYWRNADEIAKAFTNDGYLRTGDLARRDEDGFFFLVDRKKDMFISGGENVYPAEVEAVLKSHPDVAEAAIVAAPDEKWGEAGHAFILLRRGAAADEPGLRSLCEQGLARYKHPRTIRFVDEMPRTGSGKVIKAELRKLLEP